ncbi:MAG: hypothetical protein FGM24_04645 [Candidatus Kapabacteria bacterium]|nr:hypothetical protein [Candidatus Kapabacteria bacterium]
MSTADYIRLPATFSYRVDFYWQSIALYAVTLITYAVVRALWDSTIQQAGLVSVVLTDPVVVLLGLFVVWSIVSLAFNSIADRSITVDSDRITFSSSFHERTFTADEIERIVIGPDRRIRVRGVFMVVKIRIRGRRRPLRIRPALYTNEEMFVAAMHQVQWKGAGKS